jgi:RecA/RadA recombinase
VIHNKDGAGIQTVEYAGSEAGVAERQQESLYGTLDTEVTETPQLDLIVVDSITSTCTETGLEPHTRLDENHISENCRSLMKNSRKSTSSVISFTVTGLMNSNLSFNSSLDS